jgi:RHS repeat-associated protein
MTDGTGTRQYTYVPVGALGALQLQQESGPLPSSAITSSYDALGRLSQRTVQGAGAETFQYDAIGRLSVHTDDLGTFNLGYLGQTDQIASRQLASSTLATAWSYLNNTGDRRLAGIANTGLTSGQFSNFTYTTTPENFITGITESSDASAVYPAAGSQTATYNTLNQLTNLSGQALTYDANGNLTADGQRTYAWDAENRLVGIGYPGVSGKATAFTYDGLGRRATISSTPAGGGSATVTSYLWCGDDICQARNAGNTTIRGYYDEGEYLLGTPAQTLYYGIDHIGSVRRVFASTSSAPAFGYDPYGVPLQTTAPTTDFVYAGMFYNADSGLYLTNYRTFDAVAGRWLSRDPLGELALAAISSPPTSITDTLGSTLAVGRNQDIRNENPSASDMSIDRSAALVASNPVADMIPRALPVPTTTALGRVPAFSIADKLYETPKTTGLYAYAELDPVALSDPEGLQIKFYGPQGTRICGVICGGYGFRMDYGPNPSGAMLHFHIGPISEPHWGGHRPWYAPWCAY